LTHFVEQLQDPTERERAWQRYHTMRRFVEQPRCRHRQICLHFGETPRWETCGACDVCGVTLEWTTRKFKPSKHVKAAGAPRPKRGEPAATEADSALRDRLREWRREIAKEHAVPAYVIFHDATLEALCHKKPRSMAELLEIPGIGERKAERFGAKILELIATI